jgi:hypothetical protein
MEHSKIIRIILYVPARGALMMAKFQFIRMKNEKIIHKKRWHKGLTQTLMYNPFLFNFV